MADLFAYAVGRVRALEAHMLDESKIIRMADAKDFEAAFLVLRETPAFAEKIDRLEHPFDFEALLKNEMQWVRELLESLAPGNEILSVMWKKYDPELPLNDYLKLLNAAAEKYGVPLFCSYARGFTILNRLKLDLAAGKFDLEAVQNQYRFTDYHRAVNRGLDHFKKSGSLFALEREIDNHLMEILKKAKFKAFGIEPLIGFMYAKEIENKILRLILTGKRMQVKTEAIKERLRLSYV